MLAVVLWVIAVVVLVCCTCGDGPHGRVMLVLGVKRVNGVC